MSRAAAAGTRPIQRPWPPAAAGSALACAHGAKCTAYGCRRSVAAAPCSAIAVYICQLWSNVEQPVPELPAHFSTGTDNIGRQAASRVNFAVAVAPMAKAVAEAEVVDDPSWRSSASSFTLGPLTFGECRGCPAHDLSAMCPGSTVVNPRRGVSSRPPLTRPSQARRPS